MNGRDRRYWRSRAIGGLAAPFGQVGTLKNGQRELFEPGSLYTDRYGVRLDIHHLGGAYLYSTRDAFDIWTTSAGLWFRCVIKDPRLQTVIDYLEGAIYVGASVGMSKVDRRFEGGIWRVKRARLDEISLTRFPVYKQTFAILRN